MGSCGMFGSNFQRPRTGTPQEVTWLACNMMVASAGESRVDMARSSLCVSIHMHSTSPEPKEWMRVSE